MITAPLKCSAAIAYTRPWRVIAAVLIAVSRGYLPLLLVPVVLSHTPILPLMLLRA